MIILGLHCTEQQVQVAPQARIGKLSKSEAGHVDRRQSQRGLCASVLRKYRYQTHISP